MRLVTIVRTITDLRPPACAAPAPKRTVAAQFTDGSQVASFGNNNSNPTSVGTDQVAGADAMLLTVGLHLHAIGRLVHGCHPAGEEDLHMWQAIELRLDALGQLPLRSLQPKRKCGAVHQELHVELGHDTVAAVALLGVPADQAAAQARSPASALPAIM